MFFIARTVAAMFTGSCGSYNTTQARVKIESVTPNYSRILWAVRLNRVTDGTDERSQRETT